jgi:spore germination protein GerM
MAGSLLIGTLLLAACGVPTGGAPHAVNRNQVPGALLAPARINVPTTAPPKNVVPVNIFLLGTDASSHSVTREVPFPAGLGRVLDALMAGPTQGETLRGLVTAIPPGTRVLLASLHDDVATVDLSAPFGQTLGVAQVQAVSQVVFTVAADTTQSTGVQFEVEGKPIEVPVSSGQLVPGPVYAWAYVPTPPAAAATTTTTTPPTTTTT